MPARYVAYDAVTLAAVPARTQGSMSFSALGFAAIDGLFRFRADGTNERASWLKVTTVR